MCKKLKQAVAIVTLITFSVGVTGCANSAHTTTHYPQSSTKQVVAKPATGTTAVSPEKEKGNGDRFVEAIGTGAAVTGGIMLGTVIVSCVFGGLLPLMLFW